MSVNLGPIAPGSPSLKVPANPQRDGLGYNPSELPSIFPLELNNAFFSKTKHMSHSDHLLSLSKQTKWVDQLMDRPRMSPPGC